MLSFAVQKLAPMLNSFGNIYPRSYLGPLVHAQMLAPKVDYNTNGCRQHKIKSVIPKCVLDHIKLVPLQRNVSLEAIKLKSDRVP